MFRCLFGGEEDTSYRPCVLGVGWKLGWEEVGGGGDFVMPEGGKGGHLLLPLCLGVVGEVFGMGGMRWSIVSFRLDFIRSREVSLFKPWAAVKRTR